MAADELMSNTKESSITALAVVKQSVDVIRQHPQLLIYPYLALLVISITSPLIGASFIGRWYNNLFNEAGAVAPHHLSVILGIVGFSFFYAAFVSAYFTTAVSAAVLKTLASEEKVSKLYGLSSVVRHFSRVTKFAILSLFLLPMGIYAQRRKLPRGIVGVVGSSITLHMAQIAPSILDGHDKYGEAIRNSVDRLGRFWKEGLTLKIWMYIAIFIFFVTPKLIQHHWYKTQTASNIGWLLSLEAGASGIVFFKVINAVFTAVMYHQADKNK